MLGTVYCHFGVDGRRSGLGANRNPFLRELFLAAPQQRVCGIATPPTMVLSADYELSTSGLTVTSVG
jgi:hypothetical protein